MPLSGPASRECGRCWAPFRDESVVKKQKPAPDKAIPQSGYAAADVKPSTTVILRASEPQEIVASGHPRKVKQELLPGPSEAEKNIIRKGTVYTGTRTHPPGGRQQVSVSG